MKHDLAHEVAQDEAIMKLANALASVAAKCDEKGALKLCHDVIVGMNKDVYGGESEAAPSDPAPSERPTPLAALPNVVDETAADWPELEVK